MYNWRVSRSKTLSCKHERLFDLLPLGIIITSEREMKMSYYMGMDIGGTSARIRISLAGQEAEEYQRTGCTLSTCGYEKAKECYENAVLPVLQEIGVTTLECAGLCIAASGIDSVEQEEECRKIFAGMGFAKECIQVYNDCEIFLESTKEASLVLVAGTGSVAFGKSVSGRIVRSGGWSHVLSDEGSAMDIGKRVLKVVGNHMDGRAESPVLFALLKAKTGISSLAQLDTYISEGIMEKTKIAGLAPLAEEGAKQGEKAAERILEDCAEALFALVKDTYEKAKENDSYPGKLYLWGSVLLKNRIIEEKVRELCKKTIPALEVAFPDKSALELAWMLAIDFNKKRTK